MPTENSEMRRLLRDVVESTRLPKYGQFEHSARALSQEARIAFQKSAELWFLLSPFSDLTTVAADYTKELSDSPDGTAAVAAVRYSDGPSLYEDELGNPGEGHSGLSAAITDPAGAGPFDLAEDTDRSSGRFYFGATASFEMRTVEQKNYLVVTISNDCTDHGYSISEFYFNGPDGVDFDSALCVSLGASVPGASWEYNQSVL